MNDDKKVTQLTDNDEPLGSPKSDSPEKPSISTTSKEESSQEKKNTPENISSNETQSAIETEPELPPEKLKSRSPSPPKEKTECEKEEKDEPKKADAEVKPPTRGRGRGRGRRGGFCRRGPVSS